MSKCDIILVSFNALEFLKRTIQSIKAHTSYPYHIIIVDNNSGDDTKDYLKSLDDPSITVQLNAKNYGFGFANNQGLELGSSDYVCFLNTDVIVTDHWLEDMVKVMEEKKAGFVGPTSNYVDSKHQLVSCKVSRKTADKDQSMVHEFAKEWRDKHQDQILKTNRLIGFCLLTKREVLDNVGVFDERYEIGMFEDDDLCLRAIERGYELYCARDVFIFHFGGESFKSKVPRAANRYLDINQKRHETKWYDSKRVDSVTKMKAPLKIVYLMASDGPSGGVKIIFEHANRLKARGHDVEIICGEKQTDKPWFNVKVPITYNGLSSIPKADIVVGTYFSTLPYVQSADALVKVHLCQGYEAHLHEDKAVLETIRNNYRMVPTKVVVSKWLKGIIDEEYEIDSNYVGNAVDRYVFSFQEHSRNEKPRILVVGDDGLEIKGINYALDAIGDLVKEGKVELVRLSGSKQTFTKLDCEFHQMSKMTQDEIAEVYDSCDVAINAAKKVEGFSLPPLEAMASGTPVITTDCGGVVDYANEFNAYVVPAENPQAIREKLDLLLKNPISYSRLVQRGLQTSKEWVWYKQIDKLEALYYDLYYTAQKTQTEQLSVCMIVKNEEEHLEKCLSSVKGLASELVIVDTGSTDRTVQIAKKFGARVFHFEWNDDFSAARNFALEKVTEPWTFIMDADEEIDKDDIPKIRSLLRGEKKAYNIATRNYVIDKDIEKLIVCDGRYKQDKDYYGWVPSVKVRLFPTHEDARFKGKVHELVEESLEALDIKIEDANFQVLHYGYLRDRSARDATYAKLGEEKLKENADDTKAIYELAIQYMTLNNYDEALVLWRRVLLIEPNNYEFLARMGTTYNLLENYPKAISIFKQSLKMKESEYGWRHLGIAYAKQQDYQNAYDCFKKIVHYTKDFKCLGDFAYCCNVLRKFDESIMVLERAIRTNKKIVLSWGLLELAYNEKGIELAKAFKFKPALDLFNRSLAVNPGFVPAKKNIQEVLKVQQAHMRGKK